MTFVSEMAEIRICGWVFRRGNNTIAPDQYVEFVSHNGRNLSFYNNKLYDLSKYIEQASKEVGNKMRVGHEESAVMRRYAEQAIKDIKTSKLKPDDTQPDFSYLYT